MIAEALPGATEGGVAMKLGRIGQVGMTVGDIDACVEFYRDRLGLRLIARAAPGLAFFDCGGVRLMLSAAPGGATSGNSILYFTVADIRRCCAELRKRGVEVSRGPLLVHSAGDYELWMAFFEDPSSNTVAVMEERGEYRGQ